MDALASTTQTAGTPIAVTVHAFDVYGNGKNDYTSGASLGSATLGNAPGPFQPAPVYGAITWLNGNGTGNVTPKKREDSQNQTVNVTDPQGPGTGDDIVATSTTFSVKPGPIGSFTMDALASTTQTAGTPIAVTVHAFDVYGNGKNDYTERREPRQCHARQRPRAVPAGTGLRRDHLAERERHGQCHAQEARGLAEPDGQRDRPAVPGHGR